MTTDTDPGHSRHDAQSSSARVGQATSGDPALRTDVPGASESSIPNVRSRRGPFLLDPMLAILADMVDDIETIRISTDNRIRMLTTTEPDIDGVMRGLGLDARLPEVARVMALAENLRAIEHLAVLNLERHMKSSPFYPWVARNKGVGKKQAARLLAAIGDPYWNNLHDRPRTVSELWAYAGYAVHEGTVQRRKKGEKSNWDSNTRQRAYLIAVSCVKRLNGEYRTVYDAARTKNSIALHDAPCSRCGPSGTPAAAGSALSLGHQNARAIRSVAKAILKDLWIEARSIHDETPESAGSKENI